MQACSQLPAVFERLSHVLIRHLPPPNSCVLGIGTRTRCAIHHMPMASLRLGEGVRAEKFVGLTPKGIVSPQAERAAGPPRRRSLGRLPLVLCTRTQLESDMTAAPDPAPSWADIPVAPYLGSTAASSPSPAGGTTADAPGTPTSAGPGGSARTAASRSCGPGRSQGGRP
jgi:hypothetical protein